MEKAENAGEPRVVTPTKTHFVIGSLLLLVGVVALIVWCAWGNPETETIPYSYGVVFDAGSTGTRLYLYQWPGDKVNGTGIVKEVDQCSEGDALSSFETHPEDAGTALEACINKTTLPQNEKPRAFLGATAGMRLVNERNSTISDAIFGSVRNYLRDSKLDFHNDNDARIIDGYEEGISGWISTNYIMETLEESPKSLSRYIRSLIYSETSKTIGALDLGGASMQISFVPDEAETVSQDSGNIYNLRLYGVNYSVYSTSYLCYGNNEARRRYLAQIVEEAGYKEVVNDPCGHVGFNETVTQDEVWSLPCTKRPDSLSIAASKTFKLVGTGNSEECRKFAFNVVPSTSCPHQSCGIDGVFQPPPSGQFMAFSSFYYTTSGVGLGEDATLTEINETGISFCQRQWEDVKGITATKYLKTYCFSIHYIYAVLTKGFKFTEESWNIKFVDKVKNMSLSWSLGFMLNITNMIPAEAPDIDTPIAQPLFIVVAIIFAVVAVIGLCLIIYNLRKRN